MSRFGTITDPASVKTVFVESAAASDLQAKTNAVLAAIFAATPPGWSPALRSQAAATATRSSC